MLQEQERSSTEGASWAEYLIYRNLIQLISQQISRRTPKDLVKIRFVLSKTKTKEKVQRIE